MRVVFLFFLLLSGFSAHSQYLERIDSLKSHLQENDPDKKVDVLYKIAWEYRNSTPDSTISYSRKALDLAREYHIKNKQAKAYNFIGIAYHYKGDYINSFDYLSKGLVLSKQLQDSIQYGHSLNTLGRLFLTQGDLIKAYNYFFEAKQVFEDLYDPAGISHCYKSLAELYQNQKNIPKALEMLEKALSLRGTIEDQRGEISIHIELADLYANQESYDKAFEYYNHAMVIAEQIEDHVNIADINNGIALVFYQKADYKKAEDYVNEALKVVEKTDNEDLRARTYLLKGKILQALNKPSGAKSFLSKVITLSQVSGNKHTEMQALYHLHKMAESENNITKAYEYFQHYFDLRKSLEDADKARQVARMEARLEIEKKERENEILLANQARDQAVIKQQQLELVGLIMIALIVTVFMIHLWITAKNRRKDNKKLAVQKERIAIQKSEIIQQNNKINEQNKKLQKHNAELAHLNNEKDNLMNIMAHDLKGPFNRIVGLIELIKMSDDDKLSRSKYNKMIKEVSLGGIALIRDLLDVHSYEAESKVINYTKIDLEDFLDKKAEDFQRELEKKNLKLKINIEPIKQDFFSDEMYLSRIMDNLLSNAIKFSYPANKILINARSEDDMLILSIKDYGQGFSEEDMKMIYKKFKKLSARPTAGETSNGLGLAIVKNLIEQLNGQIELKSEKNISSEFVMRFPLKQYAPVSLN